MISRSVYEIWYHSHDIIVMISYMILHMISRNLLWYHRGYKNTQYQIILVYDIILNIIVYVALISYFNIIHDIIYTYGMILYMISDMIPWLILLCAPPPPSAAPITDKESCRDLQQSYGAYNFVTELEIRTVRVLSRPYNQGTYCHCTGMARRPLTVWLVQCSSNSVPVWTALFSPVGPHPGPARSNDRIAWDGRQQDFNFVFDKLRLISISANRFAMYCRPLEESTQDPETPNPVTPTKPPRNAGACHYNPDAEN